MAKTPATEVGASRGAALTELAAAETLVRELADELTGVSPGECVYCYVARMLDEFGCNERLRWAVRFRDLTAPRATALESRLGDMGATATARYS
jgi:hypothetical protein